MSMQQFQKVNPRLKYSQFGNSLLKNCNILLQKKIEKIMILELMYKFITFHFSEIKYIINQKTQIIEKQKQDLKQQETFHKYLILRIQSLEKEIKSLEFAFQQLKNKKLSKLTSNKKQNFNIINSSLSKIKLKTCSSGQIDDWIIEQQKLEELNQEKDQLKQQLLNVQICQNSSNNYQMIEIEQQKDYINLLHQDINEKKHSEVDSEFKKQNQIISQKDDQIQSLSQKLVKSIEQYNSIKTNFELLEGSYKNQEVIIKQLVEQNLSLQNQINAYDSKNKIEEIKKQEHSRIEYLEVEKDLFQKENEDLKQQLNQKDKIYQELTTKLLNNENRQKMLEEELYLNNENLKKEQLLIESIKKEVNQQIITIQEENLFLSKNISKKKQQILIQKNQLSFLFEQVKLLKVNLQFIIENLNKPLISENLGLEQFGDNLVIIFTKLQNEYIQKEKIKKNLINQLEENTVLLLFKDEIIKKNSNEIENLQIKIKNFDNEKKFITEQFQFELKQIQTQYKEEINEKNSINAKIIQELGVETEKLTNLELALKNKEVELRLFEENKTKEISLITQQFQIQLVTLQEKIQLTQQQNFNLNKQLNHSFQTIQDKDIEIQNYQLEIQNLENGEKLKILALEEQLSSQLQINEQQEGKLLKQQELIKNYEKQLNNLQVQNNQFNEELKKFKQDDEKIEQKLLNDLNELKLSFDSVPNRSRRLSLSTSSSPLLKGEDAMRLKAKMKEYEKKIIDLINQNKSFEIEFQQYNEQIEQMKKQISYQQEELKRKDDKIEDKKRIVDQKQILINQLVEQIDQLENEMKILQNSEVKLAK